MTDILYPVKDAAQRLGISVWTLRKLAYLGDIASVKLGVKLLIPESELVRLIQEGLRPRRSAAAQSTSKAAPALGQPEAGVP